MFNWIIVFVFAYILLLNPARLLDNKEQIKFSNLPILKEGDIIFRKGTSAESYTVLMAQNNSNQKYSHVGIIHFNQQNLPMVIHAAPSSKKELNRVKLETIDTFWSTKNAIAGKICRKQLTPDQKATIQKHLISIIQNNVEFDDAYDLKDTSKLYCTELLYHAFKKAGIDITNGHTDTLQVIKKIPIILPATILRNNKFKTVHLYQRKQSWIRNTVETILL